MATADVRVENTNVRISTHTHTNALEGGKAGNNSLSVKPFSLNLQLHALTDNPMTMTITGDVTVGAELESLPKNLPVKLGFYQNGSVYVDGVLYPGSWNTTLYYYYGQIMTLSYTGSATIYWALMKEDGTNVTSSIVSNNTAKTIKIPVTGAFTKVNATYA